MATDIETLQKQQADLEAQRQKLQLQASQLDTPTPTGFGKQITAQAQALDTPNVGSAVLKAIALGMGGQEQRREAKTQDEANAKMQAIISKELERTEQLRQVNQVAMSNAKLESGLVANAQTFADAVEQGRAGGEAYIDAQKKMLDVINTVSDVKINNVDIDYGNYRFMAQTADGRVVPKSFTEVISLVRAKNPEQAEAVQHQFFPNRAKEMAQAEGRATIEQRQAELDAIAEKTGKPVGEAQRQATLSGAKFSVEGTDIYKNAEAKGKVSGVEFATEVYDDIVNSLFEGGDIENGKVNNLMVFNADMNMPFTEGRDLNARVIGSLNTILRIESGAAVPEPEIERYLKVFMPTSLDNNQTKRLKIKLLGQRLNTLRDAFDIDPSMSQEEKDAYAKAIMKQETYRAEREVAKLVKQMEKTPTKSGWTADKEKELQELYKLRDAE